MPTRATEDVATPGPFVLHDATRRMRRTTPWS